MRMGSAGVALDAITASTRTLLGLDIVGLPGVAATVPWPTGVDKPGDAADRSAHVASLVLGDRAGRSRRVVGRMAGDATVRAARLTRRGADRWRRHRRRGHQQA